MPRHIWTVLCRKAILDPDSNNFTLVETFEELQATPPGDVHLPAQAPLDYHTLTFWSRGNPEEPEQFAARYRWRSPNGEALGQWEQTVDLTEHKRLRTRGKFAAFAIGGNGIHEFEISVQQPDGEWQVVASIPLDVKVRAEQTNDVE